MLKEKENEGAQIRFFFFVSFLSLFFFPLVLCVLLLFFLNLCMRQFSVFHKHARFLFLYQVSLCGSPLCVALLFFLFLLVLPDTGKVQQKSGLWWWWWWWWWWCIICYYTETKERSVTKTKREKNHMPYDFLVPIKEMLNDGEDAKIQRELVLWQLRMREERQRRLLAADEKAGRRREPVGRSASHQLVATNRQECDDPPHPSKVATPLQEYRRELSELTHGVQNTKNAHWYSNEPKWKRRHMKQSGVTYHEARSVLREYIHRPLPPSSTPRRTPSGALQGYKDALALSARLCDHPPCTSSSWHKKPLRTVSVTNRKNSTVGTTSVSTTRSAALRRRHTNSIAAGRNGDCTGSLYMHRTDRTGDGGHLDRHCPQPILEPTGIYQKTLLQHQGEGQKRQTRREIVSDKNEDFKPQRSESSFFNQSERRSATRPMASCSPVHSPQPRQPIRLPSSRDTQEPVASAPMPVAKDTAPAEVFVSPPTPVSNCIDNASLHHTSLPRREVSPLLTELLNKIVLPKPSLYRPDLYQGQRASDVIDSVVKTGNQDGKTFEETTSDVARGLFSGNLLT